jgi:hypothetical protein
MLVPSSDGARSAAAPAYREHCPRIIHTSGISPVMRRPRLLFRPRVRSRRRSESYARRSCRGFTGPSSLCPAASPCSCSPVLISPFLRCCQSAHVRFDRVAIEFLTYVRNERKDGFADMPRPPKLRQVTIAPAATFFKPSACRCCALDGDPGAGVSGGIRLKTSKTCTRRSALSAWRVARHLPPRAEVARPSSRTRYSMAKRYRWRAACSPSRRTLRCRRDGSEWTLPPGPLPGVSSVECPTCRAERCIRAAHGRPFRGGGPGRWGHGWQGPWGQPAACRGGGGAFRRTARGTCTKRENRAGCRPGAERHNGGFSPRQRRTLHKNENTAEGGRDAERCYGTVPWVWGR